jgi:putative endonuclease
VSDHRRRLGQAGEAAAAAWYEANGYEILARNWRCQEGELDLVLRRAGTVVFCEVKTRTSVMFGAPVEAITRTKRERLRRLAVRWLSGSGTAASDLRFDVASVLDGEVEVLQGAF